jgi:hypothetical protein
MPRPRHRARLGDPAQRGAGHDDDRRLRQLPEQVPDGVRLARAGRAVQQDPALEVLTAGAQAAGLPGDAEDMPLDAGQDGGRQDHAGPVHLRALLKLQRHALAPPPAEDLATEGDDLPAEHVVPDDLVRDPVQHPLGALLLRGARLQGDPVDAGALVRPAQQDRDRGTAGLDEVDRTLDAGHGLPARPGRHGVQRDAAHAHAVGVRAGLQQVTQAEDLVPEAGQADQLMAPARPGQPGAEARLHVDVVIAGPGRAHDRQAPGPGAEVLPQQLPDRGVLGPGGGDRLAHQPPAQAGEIGEFRPRFAVQGRVARTAAGGHDPGVPVTHATG